VIFLTSVIIECPYSQQRYLNIYIYALILLHVFTYWTIRFALIGPSCGH